MDSYAILFRHSIVLAAMAELADALDSGSSELTLMEVQVLLAAPKRLSYEIRWRITCDSLF